MSVTLAIESALTVLLAATLIYCVILERKLSALRKGQDGLKTILADLDQAILTAGNSMRALKASAAGAAEALDGRIARARALADELSVVTASGERIAERIERGTSRTKLPDLPSASVMGRLELLRSAS